MTIVATSHFTLWGSGIDTVAGTVVSVKVYRCVKADLMAVFGCGCCAVEPRTKDLSYETMDLRRVNVFTPLPLADSALPVA